MTYIDELAARIRAEVARDVGVPDDSDGLFRLYALLARAKGAAVTARDVHDAWVIWMQGQDEDHDALVPFEELDRETQAEDSPFVLAIRSALAGD
jgi:hypothetical protein